MKHITVRNVPGDVAEALDAERRRRGKSLNETVIDLLSQGLGVGGADRRRNGLRRLAGTWSAREQARFEAAVAPFEKVDEELWR